MERKVNIATIIDDLKKSMMLILLGACICAMIQDVFLYKTRKPIYSSEAILSVTARKGDTRYALYTNLNVTSQMAKTFSYIMNSEIIEQIVQEDLGVSSLNGKIQMSVTDNTNMVTLKVNGNSPQETFEIMRSVLNSYQPLCDNIMPGSFVELLQTPKVPIYPANALSHSRNLIVGFIGSGLLFSAMAAFYSYMKDTVKQSSDISEKIDAPLFATLPYQKNFHNKSLLVSNVKTSFSYVEAMNRMRVKLEGSQAKVVLVTSALENEGKSTISANLAITLAKNKKKVLLMDLDLRNTSLADIFNYSPKMEILDYLEGKASLKEVLVYDKSYKLSFIFGKRTSNQAPEMIESVKMRQLINGMRKYYDYIIIDSTPSYYLSDALVTAELCDTILMIVKQNNATCKLINDTIDQLSGTDKPILGCVFNHSVKSLFNQSGHYRYYGGYYGYYGYKKYGYGGYGSYERNKDPDQ